VAPHAASARDAAVREAAVQRLSRLYPHRDILLTDSGTSALLLALRLTRPDIGHTPMVALPAYACPDVGAAAVAAGYTIMLYDTDPATLQPDLASVRRCLEAGCLHVVAVHLFGWLVDVPAIVALAVPFGARVIEDAAQHAGATWGGVRGGALADWSVLSFGRGKGINAGGGGALLAPLGAAATTRVALTTSRRAASAVVLGTTIATELLSSPWMYWLPRAVPALRLGETVYHAAHPPGAITLTSAVLLPDALEHEADALQTRRGAEHHYRSALKERTELLFDAPDGAMQSGALRFPVRLPVGVGATLGRWGVARSYPRTLAEYAEVVGHLHASARACPGAQLLAECLHTLPTHAEARVDDREALVQQLRMLTR
jgi:dTDP-4-amino-4,6-dideoxygalactose transaminase